MRTYKDAMDEFVESYEFKGCTDPESLGAPPRMRQYLENRLKRAFEAGWLARAHMPKEYSDNGQGEP